jgi:hypothetical protein
MRSAGWAGGTHYFRGYLWQDGRTVALQDCVPADAPYIVGEPADLNESDQVVLATGARL